MPKLIFCAVRPDRRDTSKCSTEVAEKGRTSIGHLTLDGELCRNVDLANPDSHHKDECAREREDGAVVQIIGKVR